MTKNIYLIERKNHDTPSGLNGRCDHAGYNHNTPSGLDSRCDHEGYNHISPSGLNGNVLKNMVVHWQGKINPNGVARL